MKKKDILKVFLGVILFCTFFSAVIIRFEYQSDNTECVESVDVSRESKKANLATMSDEQRAFLKEFSQNIIVDKN